MSAPTKGINQRRDKTPTMSGSSEEPLHKPLAEHQEEQDDQSHDDDPGVALHLARLSLPQTPARPDRLEAHGVHGAVDHTPIEGVALYRHPHPTAADRVYDPVDHIAVEPVQSSSEADDDVPTERVVDIVDPVPTGEHPMEERAPSGGGETLRGNPFRGVDGPGQGDPEDRDAQRRTFEHVVRPWYAHAGKGRFGPPEEHEVPEPSHRIGEEARHERDSRDDQQGGGHDAGRFVRMLVHAVIL